MQNQLIEAIDKINSAAATAEIDLNSGDGFMDTKIAPKEGGSDGKAT